MGSVRSSVALGHAAAPAGARQAKGLSKTCLFSTTVHLPLPACLSTVHPVMLLQ